MMATDVETGLTAESLRGMLYYDPLAGLWVWRIRKSQAVKAGNRTGSINSKTGYAEIMIDGRRYKAHRLAWLYMTGEWPTKLVDHKDLDRANNRWANLRAATNQENQANRTRTKTNTSGFKGVTWAARHRKWRAQICPDGRSITLGHFDDPLDAHAAYVRASSVYFGEFGRAR